MAGQQSGATSRPSPSQSVFVSSFPLPNRLRSDSARSGSCLNVSRRRFLEQLRNVAVVGATALHGGGLDRLLAEEQSGSERIRLADRIEGLLIGTLLGDALGGPVEFQPPDQVHALPNAPKVWQLSDQMDAMGLAATAARLQLRGYTELRPVPEPYAHWSTNAPAGTITDDSRHKIVLMHALRAFARTREAKPSLAAIDLAHAYRSWRQLPQIAEHADYATIKDEWLHEFDLAIAWMDGERDVKQARPPSRLWNSLATCCGQMTLPPFAAIFPGEPVRAYRGAYALAFFDNGFAKDMNAALVAGISHALMLPGGFAQREESWQKIVRTVLQTDPFGYRDVPWSQRAVEYWMQLADKAVADADHHPAHLFATLEETFKTTIKWEAQVPFVILFSCAKICNYDPLAALQLSIEWGHDTDSYAQLLGAFVGALHGATIFPDVIRTTITNRLKEDYGEDLHEWVELLLQ